MKVTLLKDYYVAPRLMELSDVMELMRSGKQAKKVLAFRNEIMHSFPETKIPEEKKTQKVFFSSVFGGSGINKQWAGYSGIMMVEVNNIAGIAEAEAIRQKAAECLQTLATFIGSSGQSVKILTVFTRPDGTLPTSYQEAACFHAHALKRSANFYRMLIGQEIILKETLLDDYCRLSYDPSLYFNPHAAHITMEQPLGMPGEDILHNPKEINKDPWERMMHGWEREERIAFLFDMALQETLRHHDRAEEPEAFMIALAENCFRSGVPEEEAVKRIRLYSKLGEYEKRVRTAIHNVYQLEKGFGTKPVMPSVQRLAFEMEEFMERRYDLRRNILKKQVEYREKAALFSRFHPLTDEALNTISLQAHEEGLDFWDRDVKRYLYSNRIPHYNPVDDYLSHLPAWDGQDHIRKLADTLPTDNPHWPLCFYRWFLGMVAQWKGINRMHGNCVVPLLSGEQSTGKSTWCKHLLPPELRDYYAENLDLSARRNAELALNRFALINLDEFDSIPENRQPLLKHLLQLPEVTIRRPHRSHTEVLPRYASFIATCNPSDVLTDPTGSRRYLCVEVKDKILYEQFINYPQLYAQALTALKQGERYWPDRQEELLMTEYNEAFSRLSPEEQMLLSFFRPVSPESVTGEWISAIDILTYITKHSKIKPGRTNMTLFGRILRKHNFSRRHTAAGNFYKTEKLKE